VKTIIERNTPLPARKQYGLTTTRDGQTEFELVILQGEGPLASGCDYLGTLRLEGLPPGPRGMVKIAVSFELGAECLLTVTARELNTNRKVQAVMSAKEGHAAARRKLEQGDAAATDGAEARTAVFPMPPARGRTVPAAAPGGVSSFLRRILGRGTEAR
jgi:molecular chaperone DnaK